LAIVLLLLMCVVAGLLARVALARRAVGALEANRARGHGLKNPRAGTRANGCDRLTGSADPAMG
jgi:hypothetical protein